MSGMRLLIARSAGSRWTVAAMTYRIDMNLKFVLLCPLKNTHKCIYAILPLQYDHTVSVYEAAKRKVRLPEAR